MLFIGAIRVSRYSETSTESDVNEIYLVGKIPSTSWHTFPKNRVQLEQISVIACVVKVRGKVRDL